MSGEIDSIWNSFWGGDNYIVMLKPGWIPEGCSGNTSAVSGAAFMPGTSFNIETYERSFVVALSAYVTNAPVKIFTPDAPGGECGLNPFSIRIDE